MRKAIEQEETVSCQLLCPGAWNTSERVIDLAQSEWLLLLDSYIVEKLYVVCQAHIYSDMDTNSELQERIQKSRPVCQASMEYVYGHSPVKT